jgi:hypothetical protein
LLWDHPNPIEFLPVGEQRFIPVLCKSGSKVLSKNRITIEQLKLACKHFDEMRAEGVSENLAIRTLEMFADFYAKLALGGTANPHYAHDVPKSQWSVEARNLDKQYPGSAPRDRFRVEHGTPKRSFARAVVDLYRRNELTEQAMLNLATNCWKLAVITLDEDRRLNKMARSRAAPSPDERWRAAGIAFEENSP